MTDEIDTSGDGSDTTTWRVGPFSLAVIAVLVLADLVMLLGWADPHSETYIVLMFGLTFGQAGAMSLLAFAKRTRQRLLVAMGSLIVGALLALLFSYSIDNSMDVDMFAIYALLFLQYQLAILLFLFLFAIFRRRSALSGWQPRFVVRQLLALMIITAIVGTIVRMALPEIGVLAEFDTLVPFSLWTVTAIAAGGLLLNHPPSLWRLGAFAAVGLTAGYLCGLLIDWSAAIYVNVVQMATLVLCLIVPQLDRYKLRIQLEPRDVTDAEQHLDENA